MIGMKRFLWSARGSMSLEYALLIAATIVLASFVVPEFFERLNAYLGNFSEISGDQ